MLYQALTKVDPLPGKEIGPVIFVIRQRQEPLTVSQSEFQLFDSQVNKWLHVTFCPFSTFLKRGDKKCQKRKSPFNLSRVPVRKGWEKNGKIPGALSSTYKSWPAAC